MPTCSLCGNTISFSSSGFTGPYRNSILGGMCPGVVAIFSAQGLSHWEGTLTPDSLNSVCRYPEQHVDQCYQCGSTRLLWP